MDPTESSLRTTLLNRPNNGRVMAQLACLLAEKAKQEQLKTSKESLLLEARSLADRSIQKAPAKPFGFAALSMIDPDLKIRMSNIQKAVDRSQDPVHAVARVSLLIRRLVEPREEETRRVRGSIGRASNHHPSRRPLDSTEETLYKRIQAEKLQVWDAQNAKASTAVGSTSSANSSISATTSPTAEFLAIREYRLGQFFRKLQPLSVCQSRAKQHFRIAHDRLPDGHDLKELALFWLATMASDAGIAKESNEHTATESSDDVIMSKCPAQYIVSLYSTFADRFDDLLVEKLNYQTPSKLRKLLDSTPLTNGQIYERAADLGCGTGLSGEAFRSCTQHLVGVDLSPEMVAKAILRDCYEDVSIGDVTSILQAGKRYSLVFACDVFVYFGDLEDVFRRVHESLDCSGVFAFSTELLDEKECSGRGYSLHSCARFAHKRSYVEQLLGKTEYGIVLSKVSPIRTNQGKDVAGFLVVAKKL